MGLTVRSATLSDIPALSNTLARAFYDDPVMVWMLPDDGKRLRRLSRLFAAEARYHHLRFGGVELALAAGGAVVGATLWDPPGRWKHAGLTTLRSLPAMVRVFGSRLLVGAAVEQSMDEAHPDAPHWYLSTIGTDPSARGGGYGSALLTSRLDRVDAECAPAYLESSKQSNIGYYERFGFQVTGEIVIPKGGPTLWPMWRQPR